MSERKPSKPWRVYGARGLSTDYRGQRGAYDAVSSLTKAGTRATVYHWEEGRWVKYEVIEAQKIHHRGDPRDNEGAKS